MGASEKANCKVNKYVCAQLPVALNHTNFLTALSKSSWGDDDKAVALITSLRGAAAEICQVIPEGKSTEFAAIMGALERKYGSKHMKEKIQRCNYIITLDTGATHSIINSTIVKEKFDPLVGAWFRTTTGVEGAIKGKAIRNISISTVSMKHEFLVADIISEVILGMDFIAKHGFVLDMERQVLQYANVTLPLTVGYVRQVLQDVVQRQQKISQNSEAIVWATGIRELKLSKT
uniref:Peptidase A2 domain-containing protein n=1 Tax=Glossina austeni TaxID=7395 RepID=A0A1A9UXZ2_GLOAU